MNRFALHIAACCVLLVACADAPKIGTPAGPSRPAAQPKPTKTPRPFPGGIPEVDPLALRGNIVTAGSSTVFPLSQRVAEIFKDEGFRGNVTIDSIGTGAGFERFCKGELDIANASAKISAAQLQNCRANNIEPVEFRVATDALAVVMDNESAFVQSLSLRQLRDIFSGTHATWDQVNPSYPKDKIQLFSPGTDSGTFDYFVERVMGRNKAAILGANPQLSEDDNVLVRGVEGSPYAIGFFGFAYYESEKQRLRAIPIEGVSPSMETVNSGAYPLARPLYLYSTAKVMRDKPQVAGFIAFYLYRVNDALRRVAFFSAPANEMERAGKNWVEAMK